MEDKQLLADLLAAESEDAAVAVLTKRGLMGDEKRWRILGDMPNNESVVLAQSSNSVAALVEKITNGIDAILIGRCKAAGMDPRSPNAPQSMGKAVKKFLGDIADNNVRAVAEENLVLYATGGKQRPCLSLYDAGEGQLAKDFPKTFCSVVSSSEEGSYKGAIPFVQGRFNMGGCGALYYCGESIGRKLQLIVSRVPDSIEKAPHAWAYTIFCYFPHKQKPGWRYLVGPDNQVPTAGAAPMGLLPKKGAKSGEICAPRERKVESGTLVKLFDYKTPKSNICGELFRKAEEYLLQPSVPLRMIECRPEDKAKVMGVNVWDRLGSWSEDELEEGFEEGASVQIVLSNGETVPAEIRVFRKEALKSSTIQTGLRALINGQTHGRRDTHFFESDAVDKEYIADSMLVTLDCTGLTPLSRNQVFKSDRETFREDGLVPELFKKLRKELHDHPGLVALNLKRYQEKIAEATSDDDGINALEDLLADDPTLAALFGSTTKGKVASKALLTTGTKLTSKKMPPFQGKEFPTYFQRESRATAVHFTLPEKGDARVSFHTDVKNNYFSRTKFRGKCTYAGQLSPTLNLFNGRLTFTYKAPKSLKQGQELTTVAEISDKAGHGPFKLTMKITIGPERQKTTHKKKEKKHHTTEDAPSRPEIIFVHTGPDGTPITVQRKPDSNYLFLAVNVDSEILTAAKEERPNEAGAVDFVFKYGLALIAMGLLETAKQTPEWKTDEKKCRTEIADTCKGVARVIVPLCLTLPQKLPKAA
jgi:hypothetical protein